MLKVSEIFKSIQGETSYAGLPCVFVRLAGCNLSCKWCDTAYAASSDCEFTEYNCEKILDVISGYNLNLVCITGGEPLLQKDCTSLIDELCAKKITVLVETNGSVDISKAPAPSIRIMDIKTPSSGMSEKIDWENIARLRKDDQVKFVIAEQRDYIWAKKIIEDYNLSDVCSLIFSPLYSKLEYRELAAWILEDNLPVRMQLQLHKIIWPDIEKGV